MQKIYWYILVISLVNCQNNKNHTEIMQQNYFFKTGTFFIPNKITWDTIFDDQESKKKVIMVSSNFKYLYFKDSTTLYVVNSVNEIDNDTLLLGVENVVILKYNFKTANDKLIRLITNSNTEDSVTISSDKETLHYNTQEFIKASNINKASINKLY